jgi:tape measure domain-containing protein|nr:MAG TPA: tail tape measure protein [Caudoviricetes sp.]
MINLTVVIDNDEAIRKFRELQQVAKSTTSSMVTDADRMDAAMHRFGMTMGKVGVAAALAGLVKQIAQTRGEFQQLEVAFTTLLQSKEKADALMSQMVDLAAKTPFDLQGVASGARQLLAYGFAAEDITDTLTRLGNVAAGLGLPLERLTYLYGTTAVQGRVYARDMLQFTGSGIPMLQEMAKMYGKTTEEINAMVSAGKIGFEDVRKVIENMTNEGGQFYNLMQESSKTITGLISNLGDAIDTMFNEIGKSQEGVIAGVLQGTISLVENYEKVLNILIPLVATYGAYKAALIVTAALQKASVTMSAVKTFFQLAKGIRSAADAQALFNLTMKSNPLMLALSLLVGLGTAIYRYAKGANEAAENTLGLARANKKASDEADAETAKIKALQDIVNNSNVAYSERKRALDELKGIVPDYHASLTSEGKLINNNTEAIKNYIKAFERSVKLRAVRDELEEAYRQQRKDMNEAEKIISAGTGTTSAGIYGGPSNVHTTRREYTPEEKKKIRMDAYLKTAATIRELNDEIVASSLAVEDSTGKTIFNVTENLKDAQKAYSDAMAALDKARRDGSDISVVKEKQNVADNAKKALDEAKKLAGVDDKTIKATTKSQKELSDAILANDLALQQSRIDILAEGKEKELQQIELNNEKAVQQIEKSRQDLIAKNGGKPLSEEQEKSFTEQLKNTNNATDNQRIAAELKYAKQLDDVYKQITDSSLSEIDRESRGIKEKYQELWDTVTRLLDGGSISQEKAKEWFGMINQNEIADNLEAVVNKYGSAEDKITKIQKEAAAARAKATENNRTDLIPQIDKQEQQDIGTVKADELMKTDDWINLFQNLDALSSKEIYRIIDNINAQLKNADLDPINFKAVTDQLEQAQEKAITKNPFSAIVHSFKDYKTAQEKAIGLQNKYNETQDKADKENADQASLEAIRKKQQAWQSVVSTIGEMGQALGATSDLLGQFGIESAELDGVVSAFNSIASIDVTRPFSVVTGIIGGISSLIGGIFNGKDRRAQKRIERLQDQVDALQKSYEELDRAINKAYSSDAKELIEDQNKMLQQQKILIQQQIREEQSKKKTDHDQIKQWQDQIDEINNSIEDGIAKAQDAIFGSDVQSAISDFADAYAEAWASGEDRAAASKDFVKNMIKQMIVEAMKMDIAAPMQKVRDMLETFWADKIITPSEEEIINQMVGDIGSQLDGKYSWADKYLKNKDDLGQDASSKGFQTMSQETGEELNGRFTAIQEYTANIRDTVNSILLQGGQQLNETINIRDVAIQLNGNVAIIKGHTSHLEEMDNKLGKMVKIMNEKL